MEAITLYSVLLEEKLFISIIRYENISKIQYFIPRSSNNIKHNSIFSWWLRVVLLYFNYDYQLWHGFVWYSESLVKSQGFPLRAYDQEWEMTFWKHNHATRQI